MFVIPENLALQIRQMDPFTSAFGNIKENDPVMRKLTTKYYMPFEIYPGEYYKTYFSGASYIFRGNFALELAGVRRWAYLKKYLTESLNITDKHLLS